LGAAGARIKPDVAAIRAGLGLNRAAFAATFGLTLGTVRDWEQGRRRPDMAAQVLLLVIKHAPAVVRAALAASMTIVGQEAP